MKHTHITKELLRRHNACEWEMYDFWRMWPSGKAKLTRRNLVRARDLDLDWLLVKVLRRGLSKRGKHRADESIRRINLEARDLHDRLDREYGARENGIETLHDRVENARDLKFAHLIADLLGLPR